jgi:hypothetical protein
MEPLGGNGGSSGGTGVTSDMGEAGDMVESDDFLLFFDLAMSLLNAGI